MRGHALAPYQQAIIGMRMKCLVAAFPGSQSHLEPFKSLRPPGDRMKGFQEKLKTKSDKRATKEAVKAAEQAIEADRKVE